MIRSTLAVLVAAAPLASQQTFTERMNAQFEKRAPRVGDPLPAANGFTADGEPFALANDHGSMTVIVFGCLT